VSTQQEIYQALSGMHPGQSVSVRWRDAGGATRTSTVTLGTSPAN